jgi:hypothetical protein
MTEQRDHRMVKLCDTWQRKSAKGSVYFSGFMGDTQVLLFKDGKKPHPTRPNEEVIVWKLLVQERDPVRRPQQRREQTPVEPASPERPDPPIIGSKTGSRTLRRGARGAIQARRRDPILSAFLKSTFATLAPMLADFGYQVVPIKPGGKAPMLADWQTPQHLSAYLPHRDPDTGKVTDCRRWGTGILSTHTPGVDLDLRDRQVVKVLFALAAEILGPAPFRIGARPKVLLAYRSDTPFPKVTGKWFAMPGENGRADGYAPHRIEVMGAGQQFVAYAVHPCTRRPCRWGRGEPMQIPQPDLEDITGDRAREFVATAEQIVEELGATRLHRIEGKWTPVPWVEAEKQAALRRRYAGQPIDASWQQLDPETLAKTIDAEHGKQTRHGWITSCPAHASAGHRSLHITPRDGGGSLVHDFGGCEFIDLARAITSIVGRRAA